MESEMNLTISINSTPTKKTPELRLTGALCGPDKKKALLPHCPPQWKQIFEKTRASEHFKASPGEMFFFVLPDGGRVLVLGLGKKERYTGEVLRRQIALAYKSVCRQARELSVNLDSLRVKNRVDTAASCVAEALGMAGYRF